MLSWTIVKRILAPTLVLALATGGSACTGDDSSDPPPTTTSPKTTTTTPSDEAQLEQLADDWFDTRRDDLPRRVRPRVQPPDFT